MQAQGEQLRGRFASLIEVMQRLMGLTEPEDLFQVILGSTLSHPPEGLSFHLLQDLDGGISHLGIGIIVGNEGESVYHLRILHGSAR